MADKFLVIDGSSLIHRAFYALPPLTTKKGVHTGAVFGFMRMLLKLIQDVKPRWVLAAFDKSRKTFRTKMFEDYKGQRKPTPPELKEQFPLCMDVLKALNIASLEMDGYEADDIIGTFARHSGPEAEVIVVTGDRDELQLIDSRTRVMFTKRGISNIVMYDEAVFAEEYEGLVPRQIIELKGLMGDTSDNIPGVPGVGPKTAMKLIKEYGTVEEVLANAENVKGKSLKEKLVTYKDQALLSKELATIFTDVPVDLTPDTYALKPIGKEAKDYFTELEFRNLFGDFAKELGQDEESLAADAAADEGDLMGSLFGERIPDAVAMEINDAAGWEELAGKLEPSGKIWFTAETAGILPELRFAKAQLAAGGQLYNLAGEDTLKAFTAWLGTAENPKGTVDGKSVWKTCLCGGVEPKNLEDDLAVAAYLDDSGVRGYELGDLIWQYLNQDRAADCLAMTELAAILEKNLADKELTELYRKVELPLGSVLARMELAGVAIRPEELDRMSAVMAEKIAALEATAREQAGEEDFNVNSPKQLGVILFEKLGLPVIKKTKTGYSTDAKVLDELKGKHPLIETILEYRALAKLHSTYLEGLKPLINPETGRIHTHFQQLVTVTGRLSSTDPNLQNIPTRSEEGKQIRKLFVPGEGYDWLMSCDYSQIELRILAHIAQDPLLLESFRENQDVHARTASEVFGVPLDLVSSEMRSRAKAVNFGIVYGISDYGLAVQLGCTRKEAAEFIASYFERYEGVKAYMDSMVAQAREQGYVSTLLGRRRYLPDINNRNFNRRSFAERTAINTPIQGTAADIMKVAMLKVDGALKKSGLSSRVLLQVHDELVLEVKDSEREATAALVQKEMQDAFDLAVPLRADVNYGKDWADAK